MFSEMTCMRPDWARRPEAAMAIDFSKSMVVRSLRWGRCVAPSLADRGLDQAEPAPVEGAGGLEIHLVGGDLEHLVLEADGVAGRHDLELAAPLQVEGGGALGADQMGRIGAQQGQWG